MGECVCVLTRKKLHRPPKKSGGSKVTLTDKNEEFKDDGWTFVMIINIDQ